MLTPNEDKTALKIDVHGSLAGMLAVATNKDNPLPFAAGFNSTQSSAETDNLVNEQTTGEATRLLPT